MADSKFHSRSDKHRASILRRLETEGPTLSSELIEELGIPRGSMSFLMSGLLQEEKVIRRHVRTVMGKEYLYALHGEEARLDAYEARDAEPVIKAAPKPSPGSAFAWSNPLSSEPKAAEPEVPAALPEPASNVVHGLSAADLVKPVHVVVELEDKAPEAPVVDMTAVAELTRISKLPDPPTAPQKVPHLWENPLPEDPAKPAPVEVPIAPTFTGRVTEPKRWPHGVTVSAAPHPMPPIEPILNLPPADGWTKTKEPELKLMAIPNHKFDCCLWGSGDLDIIRNGRLIVQLKPDEIRTLARVLQGMIP